MELPHQQLLRYLVVSTHRYQQLLRHQEWLRHQELLHPQEYRGLPHQHQESRGLPRHQEKHQLQEKRLRLRQEKHRPQLGH